MSYEIYHNSFTSAIQEAEAHINKSVYTFDDLSIEDNDGEQLARLVGIGPTKPKEGETNKYSFQLYKKNKEVKEYLHVQIFNRGTQSNEFELNMYIF